MVQSKAKIAEIKKVFELSEQAFFLAQDKDQISDSDLQGAYEAIIRQAIQFGKENAQ